jgi:hypothetical protein
VLSLSGSTLNLTNGGSVVIPTAQALSISGSTISLTNGGSVTIPDAQALSINGHTLSLTNGGSVAIPEYIPDAYATDLEVQQGASQGVIINPRALYIRESIPATLGLSVYASSIPAPAADASQWGVNQLGELLHYNPTTGWKVVGDNYLQNASFNQLVSVPTNAETVVYSMVTVKPGYATINVSLYGTASGASQSGGLISELQTRLYHNGTVIDYDARVHSNATEWASTLHHNKKVLVQVNDVIHLTLNHRFMGTSFDVSLVAPLSKFQIAYGS